MPQLQYSLSRSHLILVYSFDFRILMEGSFVVRCIENYSEVG